MFGKKSIFTFFYTFEKYITLTEKFILVSDKGKMSKLLTLTCTRKISLGICSQWLLAVFLRKLKKLAWNLCTMDCTVLLQSCTNSSICCM